MSTIRLKTAVKGYYKDVFARFDRDLFEALKPIGMKLDIIEFTGSKVGDIVHLRFGFPLNSDWISEIVEEGEDDNEAYFIDKGTQLPWPLQTWSHKHIVAYDSADTSFIIDEMTFSAGSKMVSSAIKPFLTAAFLPRKRQYQRYFGLQT